METPMTNRETFELICYLHDTAEALRAALYGGVLQRMADAEGGLTAGRFEALGSASDHGDTTASWALRGTGMAAGHRGELANALGAATTALRRALSVAALYPPPHPADDADRAALERINGREPCCESCARLRRPDGTPRWEPIDSRLMEATTVGGRLAEPLLLCVWCVERTRAWCRLPTVAELERHHAGQRVPWPDDVERSA
jgi:hypothetical protein